jgi:RND family efflux transporter MFP subunit
MSKSRIILLAAMLALIAVALMFFRGGKPSQPASGDVAKPALTVTTVMPKTLPWSQRILASGSVLAWQEAVIGAEVSGLRLVELQVNVGDRVKKGDVLARFSDELVLAELHQQQAACEESRAHLHEAQLNAQRTQQLKDSGVMSAQELQQFASAAEIAEAQLKSAEARLESAKLKLRYTKIVSPDDGLVSSRSATVGAVVQSGAEMFRLIRQGKLEWRAELSEGQMQQVRLGQKVQVRAGANEFVPGFVARIAPSIDLQTRNGYVYITLPDIRKLKAGMFTQGEFELGKSDALTLPQSALVVRDGYSYVYRVGADNRVSQIKVITGRRQGDRVEVLGGITPEVNVVSTGAGFLDDGDLVRVEPAKSAAASAKLPTPKSST